MSDLIVTKDFWNGVNYTQKPPSYASNLVTCPDTNLKFKWSNVIWIHTKLKEIDNL